MTFILIQVALFIVLYLVFSAVRGNSRSAARSDGPVPPVPARRAALSHRAELDAQAAQEEVIDRATAYAEAVTGSDRPGWEW